MIKFLLIYYVFCLSFFIFFSSGFVDSQDGLQYLAIARRMYYDRTFEMPEASYPDNNIHLSVTQNSDGKRYSPTGMGYSVALLPAVIVEDIFLRFADLEPIEAFPLQSDWPVLLFASFTNAFFGALLAVVMYLLLQSFAFTHRWALGLSFLSVVSTNLFPYTKHVFAHMMFVSFLVLSFYFLRLCIVQKKKKWLFFSGAAFGIVVLAYNPTFLLPLPAFSLYYLSHSKIKASWRYLKKLITDFVVTFMGALPFLMIYSWFNQVRFGGATSTGYGTGGIPLPTIPEAYVVWEGLWGLLLSPGRSFLLYSPVFLLLFIFWHKLRRKYFPEIMFAVVLSAVYLYFTATLVGGVDFLVWHGEFSWGPRYLLPIIPFLYILVAFIVREMSIKQRIFLFLPLTLVGIYIQLLGVLMPYQIKFAGLELNATISGRNYSKFEYGNWVPRYSPVFKMSKTLIKQTLAFPSSLNTGMHSVRLFDGFDTPLDLGWTTFRVIQENGHISLNNLTDQDEIELLLRNFQLDNTSTYSAQVKIAHDGEDLAEVVVPPDTVQNVSFSPTSDSKLFVLSNSFIGTTSAILNQKQLVAVEELKINGVLQNITSIQYPYVSPVSEKIAGVEYFYWGKQNKTPWDIWVMHSQVYEATLDIWWLKPFYYWDLPKSAYFSIFSINSISLIVTGAYLLRKNSSF